MSDIIHDQWRHRPACASARLSMGWISFKPVCLGMKMPIIIKHIHARTHAHTRAHTHKHTIYIAVIFSVLYNVQSATWKNTFWHMRPRLKSAFASAQSCKSLRCPHEEILHPWLSTMCTMKILTSLCECAGWLESSLGAYVLRYMMCTCAGWPVPSLITYDIV